MRSAEENKLEKDLRKWFNKLQRKIQKLIDTYYEDELFFLHINKVYTIVEEMKPEYRAILLKHGLTQFYNARETTTTLYTIQQKKVSTKAGLYEPQLIREEDVGLFRTNPQIEDSLRYNTFQASDTTLARVTQNITNNLADSYHEGLGIRDAGRRITKEFAGLKGWESRRIARTEINSAQNEGAFSAYDELGVEYQMWWTGKDNRVRDSHRPLHGHIVAVGNTFSNGLLYPGDKSGAIKEWINCRCTTVPYIIPLGKMAPPGLNEFTEDQLIDIPGYRPVTVEDALNGEYPLDYYQIDGVIDQYRTDSPYRQLKNAIADELKGFIPDEDIEMLSSEFAKYKLQTDKLKFETMSAWDSEGKQVLNNYTDYLDTRIMRNEHFEDILEEKGLKLSIHNHPQGHSPIPSGIDVNKMLKTEYGLTATTDNGLIVMKLENGEYVADRISLRNAMNSFNQRLQEEFKREESKYYNRIRKAYESNKITKEQKGLALTARYQKYLVRNVERYSKELDNVLSDYGIRVKYISKEKLPKIDNYKQKQKYTILDNFNEPFKEAYGTPRFEENISNKLNLTEKELNEYRKLKAQKKAGKLKDSSKKRKLRKYEQQLQFNKYYEKYGNKLPNDPVDAGIYKNLANLPHIRKKLGKTTEVLFKIDKSKFAHKGFDDDLWSEKGIRESLDGFVDKNDLKDVSKAIFDYTQEARKHPNESATTYDKNFNPISKFIPGDSETEIKIPQEDIDMVKNSYFGLVGHSHIKSKIPLPDLDDILYGNVALNSKYNVIYAPDYGVTLIKQTKPKSKPNKNLIQNSYKEANRKRKNFLNNKTTKLKEEYKKELKHKNISDIKQRSDLRNIEDIVRHSDFEIQCEYFNKELKQYGIELIYIKP